MAADQNPVSSPGVQTAIRAMISGSHDDPEAEMFPKLYQDILFCSLSGENTLRKPTSRLLVYSHIMSQRVEQLRCRKM